MATPLQPCPTPPLPPVNKDPLQPGTSTPGVFTPPPSPSLLLPVSLSALSCPDRHRVPAQPPCRPISLRETGVQDPLPGNCTGRLQTSPPNPDILDYSCPREGWGVRVACVLLVGSSFPRTRLFSIARKFSPPLPTQGSSLAPQVWLFGGKKRHRF